MKKLLCLLAIHITAGVYASDQQLITAILNQLNDQGAQVKSLLAQADPYNYMLNATTTTQFPQYTFYEEGYPAPMNATFGKNFYQATGPITVSSATPLIIAIIFDSLLSFYAQQHGMSSVPPSNRDFYGIIAAIANKKPVSIGHQETTTGFTAFMFAAYFGNVTAVKALLQAGASFMPLTNGLDPLICALANGNADVVELLLQAGSRYDNSPNTLITATLATPANSTRQMYYTTQFSNVTPLMFAALNYEGSFNAFLQQYCQSIANGQQTVCPNVTGGQFLQTQQDLQRAINMLITYNPTSIGHQAVRLPSPTQAGSQTLPAPIDYLQTVILPNLAAIGFGPQASQFPQNDLKSLFNISLPSQNSINV